MVDLFLPVVRTGSGTPAVISFADKSALKGTLGETLRAVRPTMFFGVPRVWEKIQAKIIAAAAENPGSAIKSALVSWAKSKGLASSLSRQLPSAGPAPSSLAVGVASKVVYSKVKAKLGLDRCYACLTGAAPIARETLQFFGSLGVDIYELYGMSESRCDTDTMEL